MKEHRVTLVVAGADDDELPAESFVQQLDSLLKALAASDRDVSGAIRTEWLVTKLSKSSPGTVELVPKSEGPEAIDAAAETVDRFFALLDALQAGETPPRVSRKTVRAFVALGKPVRDGAVHTTIKNERRRANIDEALASRAEAVLAPTTYATGAIEGRLQRITTHGKLTMWIYPWVGPSRVKCSFPAELIEEAGNALDKWVQVHGRLSYPARSSFPSVVKVDDIKVLPPPDDVPSLQELRGIAPNATNGEPSEDFVRRSRDEW